MRNTIPLGKLFGIRIGLNRFVPLLALAIAILFGGGSPALMGMIVLFVVGLFTLVLLHELGHSLVARHFGVQVSQITLWPLGGVAWMDEIPEDSKTEGLIAIAGPAVNLALALIAAPLLLVPGVNALAWVFIQINLMLGLFNLIPAFPMDGGRILRAFLARKNDWLGATEKAVRIGRYIAILGGVLGLMSGRLMVPLIAFYIIAMGQRELFAMRARKLGNGFPFNAFAEAARRAQAQRAAPGTSPFGFGSSTGFQTDPPHEAGSFQSEEVRRPRRGFTDEEIAKLESSHGPLRRKWREQDSQ